jgi:hypothetical protein
MGASAQRQATMARGAGFSGCRFPATSRGPGGWPRRHRAKGLWMDLRVSDERRAVVTLGGRALLWRAREACSGGKAGPRCTLRAVPPFGGWPHPFDWAIHKAVVQSTHGVP